MALKLPNGATVSIASEYGDVVAVSAISNASPAVATAAAHGFAVNDVVEMMSGWADLAARAARVSAMDSGTFTLGGIDTTDTVRYPAGFSAGTAREITAFQQITQVLEAAMSGGEQQFYNYSFLEDVGDERQIPTIRSARSLSLTIADDPSLPAYAILKEADLDRVPRTIRFALPNGSLIYFSAYVSFSEMPTLTKNEAMTQVVTLALAGAPTRYVGAPA